MPAEQQHNEPLVPEMPMWQLQAESQPGDLVIVFRNRQAWYWRITSTSEPWPEFPSPRWTKLAQPLERGVHDCYLLARGTADPPMFAAHVAYTTGDA